MLYVQLFHGRKDPDEQMDDWGNTGPTFGPYNVVSTTYATEVKMSRIDGSLEILRYYGNLVYYDGMYYGDWVVVEMPPESPSPFEISKTEPDEPQKGHADENR